MLARDPAETAGYTRNYAFVAEADPDGLMLEGTLDWVNGDGASVLACDLELDRLTVDD